MPFNRVLVTRLLVKDVAVVLDVDDGDVDVRDRCLKNNMTPNSVVNLIEAQRMREMKTGVKTSWELLIKLINMNNRGEAGARQFFDY